MYYFSPSFNDKQLLLHITKTLVLLFLLLNNNAIVVNHNCSFYQNSLRANRSQLYFKKIFQAQNT